MSIGKLILHSNHTESSLLSKEPLISSLQKIGLVGQPMDTGEDNFLTGERFLQFISFMGCSANVCLTPGAGQDGSFCHISIKGPFSQPQLIWDKNSRPPRCPACRKTMPDWLNNIDSQTIQCIRCKNLTRLEDVSWGRHAGYGRIFIQINNVFPGEAQPGHDLLENLESLTGTEWSYFFTG